MEVLADPDFHPGTQGQLLLDYAGEVFENPGPPIQNFGTFRYVQELTILRLGTAAFFFLRTVMLAETHRGNFPLEMIFEAWRESEILATRKWWV